MKPMTQQDISQQPRDREASAPIYEPQVARTLGNLAVTHGHTQKWSDAIQDYTAAADIYRRLWTKDHDTYGDTLASTLLGLASVQRGHGAEPKAAVCATLHEAQTVVQSSAIKALVAKDVAECH